MSDAVDDLIDAEYQRQEDWWIHLYRKPEHNAYDCPYCDDTVDATPAEGEK